MQFPTKAVTQKFTLPPCLTARKEFFRFLKYLSTFDFRGLQNHTNCSKTSVLNYLFQIRIFLKNIFPFHNVIYSSYFYQNIFQNLFFEIPEQDSISEITYLSVISLSDFALFELFISLGISEKFARHSEKDWASSEPLFIRSDFAIK